MANKRNKHNKRKYFLVGLLIIVGILAMFLLINKKPQMPNSPTVQPTITSTLVFVSPTKTPISSTRTVSNLPDITQRNNTPVMGTSETDYFHLSLIDKYKWRSVTPTGEYSDDASGYSTTPEQADINLRANMPIETKDFSMQRKAPQWYQVTLLTKPYVASRKKAEAIFIGHGLGDLSKFKIEWVEG